MVPVPGQLYHGGSAYDSRYPGDLLGISVNLEYQLGDLPVSVFARQMAAGALRDRDVRSDPI